MREAPERALRAHSLVQLEAEASQDAILSQMVFDYYASGADCEEALRDNRASFARFKLLPRMLRDVSYVNMAVNLFGALSACSRALTGSTGAEPIRFACRLFLLGSASKQPIQVASAARSAWLPSAQPHTIMRQGCMHGCCAHQLHSAAAAAPDAAVCNLGSRHIHCIMSANDLMHNIATA